ncbi:hypothetical protein EJD97_016421 [Solanum chilense]|uniref:Pentacotripeptide-repeat region of PRORP domain-containing protein n=1 Tax=Solanum chilense TaxID=4083 RepID=A0A6N2B4Y6_SOLCI|nr:hypothetical protein EJD97_016421 [Solanum chilense]
MAMSRICLRNCNGILSISSSSRSNFECLDDALTQFHQMVTMKPLPSVVDFSKLLKKLINMKHYSNVVSLFREMQKLGIPIDGFILTNVINSYCLMHSTDCAFSVLSIYLKNGIPFDTVVFNTLLRGIFAENKVKDAVELFKKLVREKTCEPDEFMYAIVMNGLSKRGHTQKIVSLLRLMEQGKTQPDICIYNIVIDAHCKDGNLDAAINVLNEMKQKDIYPDIVTYTSIIDGLYGLCKEGKVEVMRNMVEKGVEPDVFTHSMIMDGYCLRGEVDRARRIFDILIDKGIEPTIFSYNILINGYCKKKNLDEAMQLFGEISQKGLKPSIVTYNTILQGLFEVGRIGVAKQLFVEMESPDLYMYGTLLDGYFKYGLVEEAMSLFNKLERKIENVNIIINGLSKNGELDKAHAIFEKLSSMGLVPDVRTYTIMIAGFCQQELLDEAKDMLRKMEDNGCFPNNILFCEDILGAGK